MNLLQFEIEAFGVLRNRHFGPLDPQLNVLFGPNEAGKTTLLNFIRTMLVGFPRSWRSFYPPTGGGRHGGSLLFKDGEGHLFTVHREAGANGGSLRLEQGNRELTDAASKMTRLMGELSSETYKTVFAFGLTELQQLSLLDNEEIKARIYSVGLGVRNLPVALERIGKRRDQIYTDRGRAKRVFEIQERLDQIEAELTGCAALAEEYGRRLATLRSTEAEVIATTKARADRSEALDHVALLAEAWPIWSELQQVKQKAAAIPVRADLPADAIQTVDRIESRRQSLGEVLKATEEHVSRASADKVTDQQAGIVRDAEHFESIRRRKSGFEKTSQQLAAMTEDRSRATNQTDALISAMGANWTAARISTVKVTSATRDHGYAFRAQFESIQQNMSQLERELDTTARAEIESQAALEVLTNQLNSLTEPVATVESINSQKSHLRNTKRLHEALKRLTDQRTLLELEARVSVRAMPIQSISSWRPKVLVATVAAVAVLIAGSIVSHGLFRAVLLLAAIALTGAGVWMFARRPVVREPQTPATGDSGAQLQALKAQEERALQDLGTASSLLDITTVDDESLGRLEDKLEAELNSLYQWNGISEKQTQASSTHQKSATASMVARTGVEQARANLTAKQREWDAWLASVGLDQDLTPERCPAFVERLEAALRATAHLRGLEQGMIPLQHEIEEFRGDVNALASRHEITLPPDTGEAADRLVREFDDANRAHVASETIALQLEHLRKTRDEQARSLEEETQRLQEFLRSMSVGDSTELRRSVEEQQRLRLLLGREEELDRKLREVAGSDSDNETFQESLRATTREAIVRQKERLNSEVSSFSTRRDDLTSEKARLATQMEELERKDRTSELLAERELLMEELTGLAREWSILTLASKLLERTKNRYEAERKPAVIDHAERFIGKVTGGKYPHISAPADTKEIHVATAAGVVRSPDQLSRGTLEQLYLALRFGLVRQFSELAVPLPVIVDEIFVNFDPERAARVADAFVELSTTNQILVLTCHPWVVDLLETASQGKANVITLPT